MELFAGVPRCLHTDSLDDLRTCCQIPGDSSGGDLKERLSSYHIAANGCAITVAAALDEL
jgi:hypothetical protein